jgi:hypothetical protein
MRFAALLTNMFCTRRRQSIVGGNSIYGQGSTGKLWTSEGRFPKECGRESESLWSEGKLNEKNGDGARRIERKGRRKEGKGRGGK